MDHLVESLLSLGRGEGGGGEYSRKVYTGRLRPEVQPLTLLYTIYDRKGTPFVYLLSFATNGTPFTYLVWNAAYILTAVIQIPLNMN